MPILTFYDEETYKKYLTSKHWQNLKKKYLKENTEASCFICEKTTHLVLHHAHYENLYHERLGFDVFIVCYDCHTTIHFSRFFFVKYKLPLIPTILMKRMYWLRTLYCLKNKRIATLFYFIKYICT